MTSFTDAYVNLLIKQYWEKTNAPAEIAMQAASFEKIKNILALFETEFDLDNATGDRLDKIGKIVGISRVIGQVIPKIAFGFFENANARGFADKFFAVANSAPFADKFERAYTDLELNDTDFRFFITAKIAKNIASGYMVSDVELSIQKVVNTLFNGEAYVIDNFDMTLTLYVSYQFDLIRLRSIINSQLLPKPQGVRYYYIVQAEIGNTFGFFDNPEARAFADKFDTAQTGGRFAERLAI